MLPQPSSQPHDLVRHGVPRSFHKRLILRLRRLQAAIQHDSLPWISHRHQRGKSTTSATWPARPRTWREPRSPVRPADDDYAESAFKNAVKVMLDARTVNPAEVPLLRRLCRTVPALDHNELETRRMVQDAVWSRCGGKKPRGPPRGDSSSQMASSTQETTVLSRSQSVSSNASSVSDSSSTSSSVSPGALYADSA